MNGVLMEKNPFSILNQGIIILMACCVFIPITYGQSLDAGSEKTEDTADSMTAIMALNYSNFSLMTINEYNDRVILDQEYNNIINRINLTMIQDEEIIDIIKVLMDTLTKYQLNEGDREYLDRVYTKNVENAVFDSISSGLTSLVNLDPQKIGRSLVGAGGAAFDYRRNIEYYRMELDESVWGLEKDAILAVNEANKKFIDVYWKLLKKYDAPDDWRLTQEQFKD
jgi:hypothetical protein